MPTINAEVHRLTFQSRAAFETATTAIEYPVSAYITGESTLVVGLKANGRYRYIRGTDTSVVGGVFWSSLDPLTIQDNSLSAQNLFLGTLPEVPAGFFTYGRRMVFQMNGKGSLSENSARTFTLKYGGRTLVAFDFNESFPLEYWDLEIAVSRTLSVDGYLVKGRLLFGANEYTREAHMIPIENIANSGVVGGNPKFSATLVLGNGNNGEFVTVQNAIITITA